LPFKLVNRAAFTADPNIFSSSEKLITSIDFIRGEDVLNVLKELSWDMIVVDEAHKLSAFDYGNKKYLSQRYKTIQELAQRCEHLLLLTATPHRGRKDTFRNLLQLLDEDIFASDSLVSERVNHLSQEGVNKFFIRRLKEQMKDWDGNPLFKPRFTKTTLYELTSEEKLLYDKVTHYLTKKRREADREANIHVSLALMVMQRRLTSSIYAIKKTLKNRYDALNGLMQQLIENPGLWKQRQKLDIDVVDLEDYDELDDQEKEGLENILSDPKKFKLFTTAKNLTELKEETEQVKELVDMAERLYSQQQEEQKFRKLSELLSSEGVLDKDEKLVIFTEHKDTLLYLENKLSNTGYKVTTIHGGKSVDERRAAQNKFAGDIQIMVATDAAGEGINLQFCRLLINWDIPWNPNRLEQRMGRIHRYGQKRDVLVFNLVAQNTREGNVLQRLLRKLDTIREQIGDDRVYDVISDVFEGISMEEIIDSTLNGNPTAYDEYISSHFTSEEVRKKIEEKKKQIGHSSVDYKQAKELKDNSDEKRLQPVYIKLFFERAFKHLGGEYREVRNSIYEVTRIPEILVVKLKENYKISADITQIKFCFNKQVFLEYQNINDLGTVHYINPGNPIFDVLVQAIKEKNKEEVLKGTVLVSPIDKEPYLTWFVRNRIVDNRQSSQQDSIANEELDLVYIGSEGNYKRTNPAKYIDLHTPKDFTKPIEPPHEITQEKVIEWSFLNLTEPLLKKTEEIVEKDVNERKEYLQTAFSQVIMDLNMEINELQQKILLGDNKVEEKILFRQERINELQQKKEKRLNNLDLMLQLSPKEPEILGCAYIMPLSQLEFKSHYGMSRDDEAEAIAMQVAMDYERKENWNPEDVSAENSGYDIRSTNTEGLKRYIEVKGRSNEGGIMLSENEYNRLAQLQDSAWLYIIINCKTKPELYRVKDPANVLNMEKKSRGIQFYVSEKEWQNSVIS
jgi:superfamily II DNA/RNA helicase